MSSRLHNLVDAKDAVASTATPPIPVLWTCEKVSNSFLWGISTWEDTLHRVCMSHFGRSSRCLSVSPSINAWRARLQNLFTLPLSGADQQQQQQKSWRCLCFPKWSAFPQSVSVQVLTVWVGFWFRPLVRPLVRRCVFLLWRCIFFAVSFRFVPFRFDFEFLLGVRIFLFVSVLFIFDGESCLTPGEMRFCVMQKSMKQK